ncbi:MAG: hypothetical protein HYU64_14065 [Armatimonadetes bacterium]|nr:hypothetical protein [Armatimonadota bacterium]
MGNGIKFPVIRHPGPGGDAGGWALYGAEQTGTHWGMGVCEHCGLPQVAGPAGPSNREKANTIANVGRERGDNLTPKTCIFPFSLFLLATLCLPGCGAGGVGEPTTAGRSSALQLDGTALPQGSFRDVLFSGGQGSDAVIAFSPTTRYLLIPRFHQDDSGVYSFSIDFNLSAGGLGVTTAQQQATLRPSVLPGPPDETCTRIRRREQQELRGLARPVGPVKSHVLPENAGDRHTFWILDSADQDVQVAATNRKVGTYCFVYVQDSDWVGNAGSVTQSIVDEVAAEFDRIYPLGRDAFGGEWSPGIDGQSKIYIFLGSTVPPYGYFYGRDELTKAQNPRSNEMEIIYISSIPWVSTETADKENAKGTLAHELQHLINFNQKYGKDGAFSGSVEETWVNEGLSTLAEFLVGRGLPHGIQKHFERVQIYESAPGFFSLTTWTSLNYGVSYLFFQYLYDWYGPGAVKAMESNAASGTANVEAVTGRLFGDIFAEWCAANYLDSFGEVRERMYYRSIDMVGNMGGRTYNAQKLPGVAVTEIDLKSARGASGQLPGWGCQYLRPAARNFGDQQAASLLTTSLSDVDRRNLRATAVLGY